MIPKDMWLEGIHVPRVKGVGRAIIVIYGIGVCLILTRKDRYFSPILLQRFRPSNDRGSARHFLSIMITTTATGLVAKGTFLVVRSAVVDAKGLAGAGIFNVALTLGMTHPMIALGYLGTCHLPALSQTIDRGARTNVCPEFIRSEIVSAISNPFLQEGFSFGYTLKNVGLNPQTPMTARFDFGYFGFSTHRRDLLQSSASFAMLQICGSTTDMSDVTGSFFSSIIILGMALTPFRRMSPLRVRSERV